MKNFLLGFCLFALPFFSQGQSKSLNYQAIIMDPKPIEIPGTPITGQPFKNGKVVVRFTLLSRSGTVDFEEFHQTTTDEFGLINLSIGSGFIGSLTGIATQATTATYRTFDAIKWDANVKQLRVDLSFDEGKSFSMASLQPFNYMAYALYAEAVEYKNVRDSPTMLSHFNNDVGYIVNRDLEPLKNEIDQNQKDVVSKFLIINQSILDTKKETEEHAKKIGDISVTVTNQGNQITNQGNQITNVANQMIITQAKVDAVANSYENLVNKSTSIQSDRNSNDKYPSVKAVKEYVDQATQGIALQVTVDGKEDKENKTSNIKTAPDPNYNYPTVAAVKQFVAESALSTDAQLVIDGKENISNKSTNVITDAGSNDKYPTVKAIKQYVDETTLGKSLVADIDRKEEKSNKTDEIKQDETNSNLYPSVLAVRKFVNDATINSLTVEKQSISLNDSKNVISLNGGENPSSITLPNASNTLAGLIQLKGDLGGTSDSPTVPGLANKENTANKTDEIKSDETNTNLFPTVLAVSKFVRDATINSLTVEKQSISLNDAKNVITLAGGDKPSSITLPSASSTDAGLIQLTGDLTGSYDAPEVKTDAITTAKILDENVTDAKIKSLSSSKLTGEVSLANGGTGASTKDGARENLGINLVDNTPDANKPVSLAAQIELDKKESLSNKTSDFVKDADSETKYPTIKSVKNYIDTKAVSNEGLVEAEKARAIAAENTKEDLINKSKDVLTDRDSDDKYPTVKSVKTYVDDQNTRTENLVKAEETRAIAKEAEKEDLVNKSKDVVTDKDSDDKYPTVKSVKTYVDAQNTRTENLVKAEETRAIAKEAEKEDLVNKSKTILADKDSDVKYPTVKSMVDYVSTLVKTGDDDAHEEIEKEKNRAIGRENGLGEEISTEKKRSEGKDAEHETSIKETKTLVDSNKSTQDAKNSEIDGRLSSNAATISTEKSDREAAVLAEKNARESAISTESAARVAALASEKLDREAALLAAKNAQDSKNSEIDGKLASNAAAISTEKSEREAAFLAAKNAQDTKNSEIDGKLASNAAAISTEKSEREAALLAAKNAQDSKNSEIDGKLASNAAAISTEKSDREAAVLAEKNARESAILTESAARVAGLAAEKTDREKAIANLTLANGDVKSALDAEKAARELAISTESAARVAALASEKLDREAAILAAKNAQETKNSEIDGKLASNAAAISTEKSDREAAILAAKNAQETKNSEIDGKLASNAAAISTEKSDREAALLAAKNAQDAKNNSIDSSLNNHARSIFEYAGTISSHETKISANSALINANANAIVAEVSARETDIAKESAARAALAKKVDDKLAGIQTILDAGVTTVGSTLKQGNVIVGDGSNIAASVAMTGDVTINESGITSISANAIGSSEIINGSLTNEDLVNKSISIGSTQVDLGGTASTLSGLTSVSATTLSGSLSGNASTSSKLASAKTIGMTGDVTWTSAAFDGSDHVTGVATIGTGKVTNSMLAGGIDLSSKVSGILPLANLPADLTAKVNISNATTTGLLSLTDWNIFNGKQNVISLTSIGSAGSATLTGSTLNIPNYSLGNSTGFTGNLSGDVTGTQTGTVVSKINGVNLASLSTGILKNTSGTGIPSIAVAADFPTLNQNTTGSAAIAFASSTQALGDSTTKIATTEFVAKSISSKANKSYIDQALTEKANLLSPAFVGIPTAPTASAGTNSTQVATTAFVKSSLEVAIAGFTGTTQVANNNSTSLATTEYVDRADALKSNIASPTFTGTVSAPTAASSDSTTKVATTEFVKLGLAEKVNKSYVDNSVSSKASLDSPNLSGTPTAPTAAVGTNSSQIATTSFVSNELEASTVTIGSAGTSVGHGVRIGNARFTINKPNVPATGSSNVTLSNSQILEAGIYVGTSTSSNKTIKIPKANGASGLVQSLPRAAIGDIITVLIVNGGNQNISIDAEDSSVTKVPGTMSVPAGTSRLVYIRVTSISSGSETISIY